MESQEDGPDEACESRGRRPSPAPPLLGGRRGDAGALGQECAAMRELWNVYESYVLPVERRSFYDHFKRKPMTLQEFEAKPQVLLLGQYSTGKTSMIRWLTGSNSVHFNIKPQPSTDKFMAVMHGNNELRIPGNAATCMEEAPFQGLETFGSDFLESFEALSLKSDVLKDITLVDTPGVLPGKLDNSARNYDFVAVCEWLAERSDMVLLMFDAHKLDISDEFRRVMEVLRPHRNKVRCLLNKADQIGSTNLLRVYGALLWNVGKVMQTPEVAKVFVSSFWSEEYRCQDHRQLFDEDKGAILEELRDLPRATVIHRTDSIVERMRRVRAHYCILTYIRSQMPWHIRFLSNEERARKWLEANAQRLFDEAVSLHRLSKGDTPNQRDFRDRLLAVDSLLRLPTLDQEVVERLNEAIEVKLPNLLRPVHGISASGMARAEHDAIGRRRHGGFLERSLGYFGLAERAQPPAAKRRRLDT